MRLPPVWAPGACLVVGGCLAGSLLIAGHGMPAASALSTVATALAAASSQCEPLPSGTTSSPSPPSATAELCVSVQATESSIKRGHAASFTVQVTAENGPASGVSVTLTGAPQGEDPEFTSRCPGGDGSATCTIGSMATPVTPSVFQMQAQIQVASGATSVTSVTVTAAADAATSPAMTTLPTASGTVTVSGPTAAASTPAATTSLAGPPSQPASASTVPAAVATPPAGSTPTTPGAASPSLISPVNVASTLPAVTPVALPPVDVTPSSVAGTGTSSGGSFTLTISAATVRLLGFIVLGLALFLGGLKLGEYRRAVRGASGEKSKRARNGAKVWRRAGIITRHLRRRRLPAVRNLSASRACWRRLARR